MAMQGFYSDDGRMHRYVIIGLTKDGTQTVKRITGRTDLSFFTTSELELYLSECLKSSGPLYQITVVVCDNRKMQDIAYSIASRTDFSTLH